MGALGQAIPGKDGIRLDLDNELEDARFFTRAEVLAAVEASAGHTFTKRDLERVDENFAAREAEKQRRLQEQQREQGGSSNEQERGSRFDAKDSGSVANVTDRSPSPSPSRRPRAGFKYVFVVFLNSLSATSDPFSTLHCSLFRSAGFRGRPPSPMSSSRHGRGAKRTLLRLTRDEHACRRCVCASSCLLNAMYGL